MKQAVGSQPLLRAAPHAHTPWAAGRKKGARPSKLNAARRALKPGVSIHTCARTWPPICVPHTHWCPYMTPLAHNTPLSKQNFTHHGRGTCKGRCLACITGRLPQHCNLRTVTPPRSCCTSSALPPPAQVLAPGIHQAFPPAPTPPGWLLDLLVEGVAPHERVVLHELQALGGVLAVLHGGRARQGGRAADAAGGYNASVAGASTMRPNALLGSSKSMALSQLQGAAMMRRTGQALGQPWPCQTHRTAGLCLQPAAQACTPRPRPRRWRPAPGLSTALPPTRLPPLQPQAAVAAPPPRVRTFCVT